MGDRFLRTLSVLVVVGAATFGGGLSQAAVEAPDLDLTTQEGQVAYFIDHGIDPAEAVVQVGARLYAGPSCPGVGFACVDPQGAPVLQVVQTDVPPPPRAFAECTGDPGANPCTIVQSATGAPSDLSATCAFTNADGSPIQGNNQTQTCSISQDNQSGGNNSATVTQKILHSAPGKNDQSGTQLATVDQDTVGAGGSTLTALQNVELRNTLSTSGPVGSSGNRIEQVAVQRLDVSQVSEDGNNDVDSSQVSNLRQDITTNGNIFISQNDPATTPTPCGTLSVEMDSGLCTVVFQRANNAYNDASVSQQETIRQDAVSTGNNKTIDAIQGNPESGLFADMDADQAAASGADESAADLFQHKIYRQQASGPGATITLAQDDIDLGKLPFTSYHKCNSVQEADLFQDPLQLQIITMLLFAHADDSCHAEQHATGNGHSSSTVCDETTCNLSTKCEGGVCDTNSVPVANNDSYTGATAGQPFSVAAPGVLGNDTDADSDPLTAQIVSNAAGVTLNANGSFSYTPTAAGTDTFTYTASDGKNSSNVATVTITVAEAPGPEPGFTLQVKNANSSTYGSNASTTLFSANIDHRLTATNAGAGDATGVTLTLTIPSGASVEGSLPSGCVQGGGAVTCSVGTVAANGGSAQRVIRLNYGGVNSCLFPGGAVPVNASYQDAEGNALNASATVTKACL